MVLQCLDRVYKWRRKQQNLRPGDVAIMKNETTILECTVKHMLQIFPLESDNLICKALIQYKNPGERNFQFSERPVQGLVLLLPVEEQVQVDSREDK